MTALGSRAHTFIPALQRIPFWLLRPCRTYISCCSAFSRLTHFSQRAVPPTGGLPTIPRQCSSGLQLLKSSPASRKTSGSRLSSGMATAAAAGAPPPQLQQRPQQKQQQQQKQGAGSAAHKALSSALCVIPDRNVWQQIQEVRCFKDKGYVRWPPHVNLLYPFLEDLGDAFQTAAANAASACSDIRPFQVTLSNFRHFDHGKSATLWLEPQPSEELQALHTALAKAFPQCTDLSEDVSRGISGFVPHLSLGQWRTAADAEAAAQELQADWRPISFKVAAVHLISRRSFHEPFRICYEVPLGGGADPVAVDVPYVATAGQSLAQPGTQGAKYGIGAMEERDGNTVWYFAYGANISTKKLTGSRGITPFESHAAKIDGWRLAYNHRGAMGNLVPLAEGEEAPSGMSAVHGVAHRLKPEDFALLSNMEHEYRPLELEATLYDGGSVPCVAFCSPEERLIKDGLPPPDRYLNLLKTGAREWPLDEAYCAWLEATPDVVSKERDDRYWTSMDGCKMAALPKIRTGSEQRGGRGRGGRRGRGQGGRGGRGGGRGGRDRSD